MGQTKMMCGCTQNEPMPSCGVHGMWIACDKRVHLKDVWDTPGLNPEIADYGKRLQECLVRCFEQACYERNGDEYDHQCLSAYEHTQDLLISAGIIDVKQCRRA